MKERISIIGLISKSNKEELKIIMSLIKKHSHFTGERRQLYKTIIKYKNIGGNK